MTVRKWSQTNTSSPLGANDELMVLNQSVVDPSDRIKRLSKANLDLTILSSVQKSNLATGFSISGGTASRTLTVTANCTIDQDLQTTASVNFQYLTLSERVTANGTSNPFYDGWLAGVFGGVAKDKAVAGTHNNIATFGAHNAGLTDWANLKIAALNKDLSLDAENTLIQNEGTDYMLFSDAGFYAYRTIYIQDASTTKLVLADSVDTDKNMALGFNATYNVGFLQSSTAGPSFVETKLNPSGGKVSVNNPIPNSINMGAFQVVGDDSDGRQVVVAGSSNNNKRLLLGFNTTSNVGVIESIIVGSSYVETKINPNGGAVSVNNAGATIAQGLFHVVGDSAAGYHIVAAGATNNNLQMIMGMDTTQEIGRILATNQGVSYKKVSINYTGDSANGIGIGKENPIAKLHGSFSTILGVADSEFSSAVLAANEMEIHCDELTDTLTLKRKYSNGTTVKSVDFTLT